MKRRATGESERPRRFHRCGRVRSAVAAALLAAWLAGPPEPDAAGGEFHVLCYHDVRDDVRGYLDADQFAVNTETLVAHLDWLRAEGYRFVSLDQVIAAQAGTAALPEKSVLLTFDDGYLSLYTRVFPLLRLYEAPALAALVTGWLEVPAEGTITYGDGGPGTPRARFISWEQAREMRDSGLVEFASHSHDLHRSVPCNPLGGFHFAVVTRRYLPGAGDYESIADWRSRLETDLGSGADLLEARTGVRPRSIVWPYGETNGLATSAARAAGLAIDFTLGTPAKRLTASPTLGRHLITSNPPVDELASLLRLTSPPPAIRALEIRAQDWYRGDAAAFGRALDDLMDRATFLGPNRILFDPYERDAGGRVTGAYFPSDLTGRRADVANRLVLLLAAKCAAEVVVRLPREAGAAEAAAWADELCQWLPIHGLALPEAGSSADAATTADAAAVLAAGRRWRPEIRLYEAETAESPAFIPVGRARPGQIAMATLDEGVDAAIARLRAWQAGGARHGGVGPLRPGLSLEDAARLRPYTSANENPYRLSVKRLIRPAAAP